MHLRHNVPYKWNERETEKVQKEERRIYCLKKVRTEYRSLKNMETDHTKQVCKQHRRGFLKSRMETRGSAEKSRTKVKVEGPKLWDT